MAHSLVCLNLSATATTSISAKTRNTWRQRVVATQHDSNPVSRASRRNVTLGLTTGMVLGLNLISENVVIAASRRPPPAPAEEKKDPNVSGVQSKVLASKKRKEAMKETVAKLREKGKNIIGKSED